MWWRIKKIALLLLLLLLPFRRYRFFLLLQYCCCDTNSVLSPLFLLVGMDSTHYNTTTITVKDPNKTTTTQTNQTDELLKNDVFDNWNRFDYCSVIIE